MKQRFAGYPRELRVVHTRRGSYLRHQVVSIRTDAPINMPDLVKRTMDEARKEPPPAEAPVEPEAIKVGPLFAGTPKPSEEERFVLSFLFGSPSGLTESWSTLRKIFSDLSFSVRAAVEGAPSLFEREGNLSVNPHPEGSEVSYPATGRPTGSPLGWYLAARAFEELQNNEEVTRWLARHYFRKGGPLAIAGEVLKLSSAKPKDMGELFRMLGNAHNVLKPVWSVAPSSVEEGLARIATCYSLLKWVADNAPVGEGKEGVEFFLYSPTEAMFGEETPTVLDVIKWACNQIAETGRWFGLQKNERLQALALDIAGLKLPKRDAPDSEWIALCERLPKLLNHPWVDTFRRALAVTEWATLFDLLTERRENQREESLRQIVLGALRKAASTADLREAISRLPSTPMFLEEKSQREVAESVFGRARTLGEWLERTQNRKMAEWALREAISLLGIFSVAHTLKWD